MIDLAQIFSELGIVSGNTNSNNQFEFYGNIEFDDGTITTNQYEFFKKIGMSRYEFFKQYGGEKEFYQNIQELGGSELNPNIYNYRTFYQNAGEYFGSSGGSTGTPFIIKVNSGSNGKFSFKTTPSYTYDYNLTTSDGQSILNQTGDYEIVFPTTNTDYIVEITGVFPHIYNNATSSVNYNIVDVLQWGNQPWVSMKFMFSRCDQLSSYSAIDIPDLSSVTDMSYMFQYSSFNGDISNWDVSNVTNMDYMFIGATSFNQDLSSWCVQNIPSTPWSFGNPSSWTLPKPTWGTCPP